MRGIEFPQANTKLLPPEGQEAEVYALHIHRTEDGRVISCWQMTWGERLQALLTGKVWLHVWGRTHPPLAIETRSPFNAN